MKANDRVKIRGCDLGDRCRAHVVLERLDGPLVLRGWGCGVCQDGNVATITNVAKEGLRWPPEMILEGEDR